MGSRYNINRNNNTIFNHITNTLQEYEYPEIVSRSIWMQDDNKMEIIELDSSSNTLTPESPNLQRSWYNHDTEKYNIKDKKKTKRKTNSCFKNNINNFKWQNPNETNIEGIKNDHAKDQDMNREINCFTIVNRHFDSSTSSENDDRDIEVIAACGDVNPATNWNRENYFAMDNFEKPDKTIWMYSFQNKNATPNDVEEINSSNETSSSSSYDYKVDVVKSSRGSETPRLPSPLPAPYVPRLNLNLGQTLSTLTEVTEPVKPEMDASTVLKRINSWFPVEMTDSDSSVEKSKKLITQMGLSPRVRRRRKMSKKDQKHCGDKAICSHSKNEDKETFTPVNIMLKNQKRFNDKFQFKSIFTSSTVNQDDTLTKIHEDIEPMIETYSPNDGSITNEPKKLRRPHITMDRTFVKKEITDPIEKLDSNNWIIEETDEPHTDITEFVFSNREEDNVNKVDNNSRITKEDVIWARNARALLKPAQWGDYLSITERPFTPELSVSIAEPSPWFSRIMNWFKCCR